MGRKWVPSSANWKFGTGSEPPWRHWEPTELLLAHRGGYRRHPFSGGAALYVSNGFGLVQFTNPVPDYDDKFGCAVAALGSDRVLVGAWGKNGNAGAAYLFSTNGALLTTLTNPVPASSGRFGYSLARVGSGQVLIGAPLHNPGGVPGAGAASFIQHQWHAARHLCESSTGDGGQFWGCRCCGWQ